MASSSCFVVIFMSILLQFLFVSASTKHIDAICQHVADTIDNDTSAFCVKSLTAYPPAVSATTVVEAIKAALNLTKSYAEKTRNFTENVAKENPKLKKQFMECQEKYRSIIFNLSSAARDLEIYPPEDSHYSVLICFDETRMVKDLIGKNRDEASKSIMKMTLMMNKLIYIADGATSLKR